MQHHVTRQISSPTFGVPMWGSNWFGSIPGPESLDDFFRLVQYIASVSHGPLMWRGQENYKWRLEPGAVRRLRGVSDQTGSMHGMDRSLERYEDTLFREAMSTGLLDRAIPPLEVFAILQHYGAATRLLDFTYNPVLALWFACRAANDIGGIVFALRGDQLRTEIYDLSSSVASLAEQRRGFSWTPPRASPRMLAQQSVFLVGTMTDAPWGCYSYLMDQDEPEWAKRELLPIYISPALKFALAGLWQTAFGMSARAVFPDIEGFAAAHAAHQPISV